MISKTRALVAAFAFCSFTSFADDIPGGQVRTAEAMPSDTYELVLSPSYDVSSASTAVSSRLRYQPYRSFGVGLGFGASQRGFHVGVEGAWTVADQLGAAPALALVGGAFLNRVSDRNFLVGRVAPMASYEILTGFGAVSPYSGLHVAHAFGMGQATSELSAKLCLGTGIRLDVLDGLQTWAEFAVNVARATDEIVLGVSFPFAAL